MYFRSDFFPLSHESHDCSCTEYVRVCVCVCVCERVAF